MTYTVFVTLEPYLAEYMKHECGGEYPIRLKKSSAEADILELYLQPQPRDPGYVPQIKPKEGQVEIVLPWFKSKDIRTYNYLPPKAEVCLHACIRNRFVVQMWKELCTVGNTIQRTDKTIEQFMRDHGISVDDKNWNTLAKIYQRKRQLYAPGKKLR